MMGALRCLAALVAAATVVTVAHSGEIAKSELVGTWRYVETYNRLPDGSRLRLFGLRPMGSFIINPDGTYNHIIIESDDGIHPAVSRVSRSKDGKAQKRQPRTLAHYGSHTINEAAGNFVGHVVGSNDPRLIGKDQLRIVEKLDDETLIYINHLSIAGGDARVFARLRRVRR